MGAIIKDKNRTWLDIAAQTASCSLRLIMPSEVLSKALCTGLIPDEYEAHLITLMGEAPIAILVGTIDYVAATKHIPTGLIWAHVIRWMELWQMDCGNADRYHALVEVSRTKIQRPST